VDLPKSPPQAAISAWSAKCAIITDQRTTSRNAKDQPSAMLRRGTWRYCADSGNWECGSTLHKKRMEVDRFSVNSTEVVLPLFCDADCMVIIQFLWQGMIECGADGYSFIFPNIIYRCEPL
jgi:hypothetical protein